MIMGGTGGPGSDRSAAQSGLTGAGLLAGAPDAPDAKLTALGVENAPQPSSGLLSGADSAIPPPTGMTSLSDTLPVAATPVTTTTAPTFNLSTTTGIAPPVSNAFALAGGIPILGFPTGVTDDMPLGTQSHVPFGTPKTGEPITGPAVTGPAIAGGAGDAKKAEHEILAQTQSGGTGYPWLAAHPNWISEVERSYMHPDGTWWAPDDLSGPKTGQGFADPEFAKAFLAHGSPAWQWKP